MCNEILPENVNLLLDDFERALCLPVLLGILYFTVILAIPLATSIYNTVQGYMQSSSPRKSSCKSKSFMSKIKGMIGLSLFPGSESTPESSPDYPEYDCDEDDDD